MSLIILQFQNKMIKTDVLAFYSNLGLILRYQNCRTITETAKITIVTKIQRRRVIQYTRRIGRATDFSKDNFQKHRRYFTKWEITSTTLQSGCIMTAVNQAPNSTPMPLWPRRKPWPGRPRSAKVVSVTSSSAPDRGLSSPARAVRYDRRWAPSPGRYSAPYDPGKGDGTGIIAALAMVAAEAASIQENKSEIRSWTGYDFVSNKLIWTSPALTSPILFMENLTVRSGKNALHLARHCQHCINNANLMVREIYAQRNFW